MSTLCIHLQSAEERKAFAVNKENHVSPILGTQTILEQGVKAQLTGEKEESVDPWNKAQDPLLLDLIASKLDIDVKDIADFELNLFDTQPATLGGIQNEFLYSARLDNLATCFVSIEGLIAHSNSEAMEVDGDISMVCLFDHEEVGSGESFQCLSIWLFHLFSNTYIRVVFLLFYLLRRFSIRYSIPLHVFQHYISNCVCFPSFHGSHVAFNY